MATNIQKFDHLASKIFADLYESFPVPRIIWLGDYISTVFEVSPPDDENMGEEAISAVDFYQHTMDWLEKAGFIEVLDRNHVGETQVGLTARGLEALKLVPDSLKGEKSLGEQLTEAAKAGVLDQIRELTGKVIGAGVSMGASYISTL